MLQSNPSEYKDLQTLPVSIQFFKNVVPQDLPEELNNLLPLATHNKNRISDK